MIPLSETIPSFLKRSGITMVVVFNERGIILDCNVLFEQTFQSERMNRNFFDCFSGRDRQQIIKQVDAMTEGVLASAVLDGIYSGRRYRWEIIAEGSKDARRFTATGHLVSVPIQENVPLKGPENWYETFFNNSPSIAWISDEIGRLILMNHRFREVVGLENDEDGKTIWELFPEELASVYHKNNMEVLATNTILKTEEVSIDKFGRQRNYLVYKFPLTSEHSRKLVGGWSIDITDKKEAENKVIKHSTQLREIAFMQSHEVRRPLANILSIVDLIKTEEIENSRFKEYLQLLYISTSELDDAIKKVMRKTATH